MKHWYWICMASSCVDFALTPTPAGPVDHGLLPVPDELVESRVVCFRLETGGDLFAYAPDDDQEHLVTTFDPIEPIALGDLASDGQTMVAVGSAGTWVWDLASDERRMEAFDGEIAYVGPTWARAIAAVPDRPQDRPPPVMETYASLDDLFAERPVESRPFDRFVVSLSGDGHGGLVAHAGEGRFVMDIDPVTLERQGDTRLGRALPWRNLHRVAVTRDFFHSTESRGDRRMWGRRNGASLAHVRDDDWPGWGLWCHDGLTPL
jgi:hypothetical protein